MQTDARWLTLTTLLSRTVGGCQPIPHAVNFRSRSARAGARARSDLQKKTVGGGARPACEGKPGKREGGRSSRRRERSGTGKGTKEEECGEGGKRGPLRRPWLAGPGAPRSQM